MKQGAKAYPKTEKEILCSECGKPILFKEYLFFIFTSIFSRKILPIHIECFGKAHRKKPSHKRIVVVEEYKKLVNTNILVTIFSFLFAVLPWLISNESSVVSLTLLSIFMPFTLLALAATFGAQKRFKKLKNEYEHHLPEKSEEKIKI